MGCMRVYVNLEAAFFRRSRLFESTVVIIEPVNHMLKLFQRTLIGGIYTPKTLM